MFDQRFIRDAVNRSAETSADRRRFLRNAGLAGAGVLGANLLTALPAGADQHMGGDGPSDPTIFQFALNLEYLEAEFYLYATTGSGLPRSLVTGSRELGDVVVPRRTQVNFDDDRVRQIAEEIAQDEMAHVEFLRTAIRDMGRHPVARPKIDLNGAFTAAAVAAGLIRPRETFNPFANETNFLLAAFIFEDVGVTAYKGAAPLIDNPAFVEAAAGILATEAYHAGTIRTLLLQREVIAPTVAISDARDSLDGPDDLDQPIVASGATELPEGHANIVPTDENGIVFSRTPDQVLNIVYLNPENQPGGFFPNGVNGAIA